MTNPNPELDSVLPAQPDRRSGEPHRAIEAKLKAREDFFRLMSHEIRTPLNGVMGMLSLLKRTDLTPEQQDYVKTATDSGDHLLSLVNDLLDYARIDAGHLDLEITDLALEPLLQSVAELLSPRAHQNGIEIAWSLDPRLTTLRSDEGRLRQILFNLAGNAVKFTKSGGVHLHVWLTDQGEIEFIVKDTGPGIPKEAQSRIFEAFAQVERVHATVYGGAGLGLVVVQKLVEALGGTLDLDSEVGRGSTFFVRFQTPYGLSPQSSQPAQTVSMLCDNDIVFAAANHHWATKGGGLKRLFELSDINQNDVILCDRRHMGATGTKAPNAKSLILLAPEERDQIEHWRKAGFAGYLIKPLRRKSLIERIEALNDKTGTAEKHTEDERIDHQDHLDLDILLVEDNPVNALLAQILLQREGCQVERAASGEDALEILSMREFDIVLMDLGLPGIDGIGATKAARDKGCRTPIIALTANAYEEDRRACLSAGMTDFMTKPIEVTALRQMLLKWGRKLCASS